MPDAEKDWHPGSNRQVLDLVHPSLYCLYIDRSLVIPSTQGATRTGGLPVVYTLTNYTADRKDLDGDFMSQDYQWLPTDFEVSANGDVKRLGYINNLHPAKHKVLCDSVTSVLQHFVPLFEKSLSDVLSPPAPLAIAADPYEWYKHLPQEDDFKSNDDWEAHVRRRKPLIPDPTPFQPPSPKGRIEFSLKGRTVQVIVKLANIMLTPEKPRYEGGSWHVEGMANEKIVATGLYYYACSNITESRLAFRAQVGTDAESMDMPYQHDDNRGWRHAYGFAGEEPLNQEMGSIVAKEGKCVVFPNIYQHRVRSFELADRTKPGYRKILCFFLVDPLTKIVSTARVPPQQREWLLEELEGIPALQKLPRELFDMIADYAAIGTITREEAKRERRGLMKERKRFTVEHNEMVFEVPYSLCEH